VNDRTSEFFDRYAVDFDSIYGNDNKALERVANAIFVPTPQDVVEQMLAAAKVGTLPHL